MRMQDALELIRQTECHPFRITAQPGIFGLSIKVTLTLNVRDIRDPDHTFDLRFDRHLSEGQLAGMNEDRLIEALWDHIRWATLHEAAEQFTVKGRRPKAPEHP